MGELYPILQANSSSTPVKRETEKLHELPVTGNRSKRRRDEQEEQGRRSMQLRQGDRENVAPQSRVGSVDRKSVV